MGTRRTKPELGSCIEVRPGVWRLRVHLGDRKYRSRSVHAESKHEAWWHLEQFIEELHDQGGPAGSFGELLTKWLEQKRHDLAPATYRGYAQSVERYLIPQLGRVDLTELRGRDLDGLYQDMLAGRVSLSGEKLNPATVRQVHAVARSALQQAVKWELIPANPALAATPPKLRPFELQPPTVDQIGVALEAAAGNPALALFLRLAAVTGARRGELCALRWSDFDFEAGVVTISHSVIDLPGHPLELKSTKTGKAKRLALDRRTLVSLRWARRRQYRQAMRNRYQLVADPFVFVGHPDGSVPWRPNQASLAWKRTRRAAGLPDTIRLHDLRHALATRMLAAGDDIRTVSGRLGHSDPSTTLRIYAHWVPEKDRAAADRLGAEL